MAPAGVLRFVERKTKRLQCFSCPTSRDWWLIDDRCVFFRFRLQQLHGGVRNINLHAYPQFVKNLEELLPLHRAAAALDLGQEVLADADALDRIALSHPLMRARGPDHRAEIIVRPQSDLIQSPLVREDLCRLRAGNIKVLERRAPDQSDRLSTVGPGWLKGSVPQHADQ